MPKLPTRPHPHPAPGTGRRCLPLLLLLLAGGLLPHAARAGEALPGDREAALEIKRGLNADFLEERLNALRRAGSIQDPQIARRFAIGQKLLEVARDPDRFTRERAAALDVLANYIRQGVETVDILPEVLRLVEEDEPSDPGTPLPMLVRYHAIDFVASIGGAEGRLAERAYQDLRRMMGQNFPPPLQARIYRALGEFYRQDEIVQTLVQALRRERDSATRVGVLEGLRAYLELTGATDDTIGEGLARHIQTHKDPEERLLAINTLELWVRNGGEINARTNVTAVLRELIETGDDEEAQIAVRLLYKSEPLRSVDVILPNAAPSARGLSVETLLIFNKALTETLNLLKNEPNTEQRTAAFGRIRDHFIRILSPGSTAPTEIKTTAAFGLGNIPIEFDRTAAVEALIGVLGETEEKALIREAEANLESLTLQKPFRTMEYTEGEGRLVETPDVQRWETWYAQNMEYLLPNEAPWLE